MRKAGDPTRTDDDESSCQLPEDIQQASYSRLCGGIKGPNYDIGVLVDLANKMSRKAPGTRKTTMPSGYVYFGQFIDHDLTRDGLAASVVQPDDGQRPNYRTPRLDLDHMYGTDQQDLRCLYDNGRLKLNHTQVVSYGGRPYGGGGDDLFRQNGKAIIVDPRNDENLIVAQMHVLWAKFHNYLLDLVERDSETPIVAGVPGKDAVEKTQNLVRWHYQQIVLNDFLPHIVSSRVLNDIAEHGLKLFKTSDTPDDDLALPIEFTMAAFRFGHSMVQGSYFIDDIQNVNISDILRLTGLAGGITFSLPGNYAIDWEMFFGQDVRVNRGETIDTFITDALFRIDHSSVASFVVRQDQPGSAIGRGATARNDDFPVLVPSCINLATGAMSLPCLTLTRGSNASLPSGEDFADYFGYKQLPTGKLYVYPEDKDFFNQSGIKGKTPLWYYLLREAALQGQMEPATAADHDTPVQKLGPIGSRIVAETIYRVLSADRSSIFNAGKDWNPPVLECPYGPPQSIYTMSDLIAFFPRSPPSSED
jgi:hypothetical protein